LEKVGIAASDQLLKTVGGLNDELAASRPSSLTASTQQTRLRSTGVGRLVDGACFRGNGLGAHGEEAPLQF